MKNKTAVILAAYNGEAYIDEQIDSILNQTYKDFDLYIRDDNSTDNTYEAICQYLQYDNIYVFKNEEEERGQLRNFSFLFDLVRKDYDYIFFADQDDIWYPDKIRKTLGFIAGKEVPTIVYTNYHVFKEYNNEFQKAYMSEIKVDFRKIYIQNWIMGCTMAVNKKAAQEIGTIPNDVVNHDYWISLVGSICKKVDVIYCSECTMQHRLHSNNITSKADTSSIKERIKRLKEVLFSVEIREKKYAEWMSTCDRLLEKYGNNPDIDCIVKFNQFNGIRGIMYAYKEKFFGINIKSTFLIYIYILLRNKYSYAVRR